MKTLTISLLSIILISFSSLKSQSFGPGLRWKTVSWAPHTYDGTADQTQAESSDDWWYWHTNIYDPVSGNQLGYIAAGYVSWSDIFYDEKNDVYQSGCHIDGPNPEIQRFEFTDTYNNPESFIGSYWSSIARFDLEGNMVWCKRFGKGEFRSVIQNEDGDILAFGFTHSTVYKDAQGNEQDLICNPGPGTDKYIVGCRGNSNDESERLMFLAKVDLDGILLENYCYGWHDNGEILPSGSILEDASSMGLSLVEIPTSSNIQGRYYLAGQADVLPRGKGPNHYPNGLVILIDEDLEVVSKKTYGSGVSETSINSAQKFISGSIEQYAFAGTKLKDHPSGHPDDRKAEILHFVYDNAGAERFQPVIFSDPRPGSFEKGKVTSISFSKDGQVYLPTLWQQPGNKWSYDNYIYKINAFTGSITSPDVWNAANNPFDLQITTNTFDNQQGITPPQDNDNGFVLVTSISATNPHGLIDNYLRNPNKSSIQAYWLDKNPDAPGLDAYENILLKTEDANGYVSCYTDGILSNYPVKKWEVEFDIDDSHVSREQWPGDIKKSECLYSITQNQNMGYTVAGNCSENFDDGYIVNIMGDCGMDLTYDEVPIVQGSTPVIIISDITIRGVITVPSGSTLKIENCTIKFADTKSTGEYTNITVEAGGELILDGCTLTSDDRCVYNSWDGIKVLGDYDEPHNILYQGKITILNTIQRTIIENARFAITLGEREYDDNYTWNSNETGGGGIIFADDAIFLDNRRSIHFSPYSYSISNPGSNTSYLKDCDFLNNDAINDLSGLGSLDYISMVNIQDLNFLGCHFKSQYSVNTGVEPYTTAITGYNCGFVINGGSRSSLFYRMDYAINISNPTFNNYPVDIISTNFSENIHGIYMKNYSWPKIAFNVFDIGYSGIGLSSEAYGLYLYDCQEYKVENNAFNDRTTGQNVHGVIVNNYYDMFLQNRIYDNYFNNLWVAISVYNKNRGWNLFPGTHSNNLGLKIMCNNFENNSYAIHCTDQGASSIQGYIWKGLPGPGTPDLYVTAANCFDNCTLSEGKYKNDAIQSITYVEEASDPACLILSTDVNCYDLAKVYFISSPLFPQDVLLPNPCDGHEAEDPRPGRRMSTLASLESELLELNKYQEEFDKKSLEFQTLEVSKNRVVGQLMHELMRSNSKEGYFQAIEILELSNELSRRINLVDMYMLTSDFKKARKELDNLVDQDEDLRLYVNMKKIILTNMENGKSINDLKNDSAFVSSATLLASDKDLYGNMSARAYLASINNTSIPEIYMPLLKSPSLVEPEIPNENDGYLVKCYPNPFTHVTNIVIEVDLDLTNSELIVYNINGIQLYKRQLSSGVNKIEFDGSSLPSGIYMGIINSNGQKVKTFKIIKTE